MRSATNRVPVLARILPCTLVLGCAALLGLPTSASAGTILTFGQLNPADEAVATFSGNTATLTTHGVSNPISPTSIPITVTQIDDIPLPPGSPFTTAFETFSGLSSSTPQAPGSDAKGGFSGTIEITSLPGGAGTNILTATFSGNGILNASGGAASLRVPENVTFTSAVPAIQTLIAGFTGNLSLSFTNLVPPQSGAFTTFTAQNSGLFATVIPEPASIVMMGLGLLGVLGYGSLRHKSSKA